MYQLGLTAVGRASLRLNVQGEIADIPKTLEALRAQEDELTPFALETLRNVINSKKE